jgi:hypothetical protein
MVLPLHSPSIRELETQSIRQEAQVIWGPVAWFGRVVSLDPVRLNPIGDAWRNFDRSLQEQFFSKLSEDSILLDKLHEIQRAMPFVLSLSDKIQYITRSKKTTLITSFNIS